MKKKNTGLKVLVIVLSVLVVTLSGYIVYDKTLSDKNNNGNELNNNIDNDENNGDQYSFSDFSGKVFNSKMNESQYFLTLWDDGKYMYTNDHHVEETLGEYIVEGNKIKLTYLYTIDRGENKTGSVDDTAKIATGTKELKIVSTNKIIDESVNVELEPVNQPTNPGGENFNTILDNLRD